MASGSNWLGFSLYPQEHQPPQPPHQTESTPAFGLSSLMPDGPFSIFEDWNAKNSEFKGLSSELSMVVGSRKNKAESSEPKLEDFLGGKFSGHGQKLPPAMTWTFDNTADRLFPNYSLQIAAPQAAANEIPVSEIEAGVNNSGDHCSIGLSMIKTWLRTQPAASPLTGGGGGGAASPLTANAKSLSLSMNTTSQSSPFQTKRAVENCGGGGESSSSADENSNTGNGSDWQNTSAEAGPRRSADTFGHRTSIYRGVTRHRWTGRYEAHLWDNSCRREGQTRKGRQVYLGGYDKEERAAIAYDLAALKYWGTATTTNFPINNYLKELEEMRPMTRQEYVASLRRKSSGFSRGASIYRGVTRHHQQGRWQARIGRVAGNKDLYLGTFSTQEEAAEAYDIAAIKFRGLNAVTNFDMNRYDVKSIMESNALPLGAPAKRSKDDSVLYNRRSDGEESATSNASGINGIYGQDHRAWPAIPLYPQLPAAPISYPYGHLQSGYKHDHDPLAALRDLHQSQGGSAGSSFLSTPLNAAVRGGSFVALHGSNGEGFLGEHGVEAAAAASFSCRNIYNLCEQTPGGDAGGSNQVCHGSPIFTIWNDG